MPPVVTGITDFSGGMEMRYSRIAPNQYRYAENIVLRRGYPQTRPGIRKLYSSQTSSATESFWFGVPAEFTGFWFPFTFVNNIWNGIIQGVTLFKFQYDSPLQQMVVASGTVFTNVNGFTTIVPTEDSIGIDETVDFIQADNQIIMLRSGNNPPMYWTESTKEFLLFDAATIDNIPNAVGGSYALGRLWLFEENGSDIKVSAPYDFKEFNYTTRQFSIRKGDGNNITRIIEYKDNYIIVFKNNTVYYLGNVNVPIADGFDLIDYVTVSPISTEFGLVASNAVASSGEMVAYLSKNGVMTLQRNAQGNMTGIDIPLSAPIQPLIDRINWDYVGNACAVEFNNYLLFSVPLDTSHINNVILVYDMLLGPNGAWACVWTSNVPMPVKFYKDVDRLYAVCTDGHIREFMKETLYSDTLSPDTEQVLWDNTVTFYIGQTVYTLDNGVKRIFYCEAVNTNVNPLTDTTGTWVEITEVYEHYNIHTVFHTGFIDMDNMVSPKKFGRVQIQLEHLGSSVNISSECASGRETDILSNIEYDPVKFDTVEPADWVRTNANLDFNSANRRDYEWVLRDGENFYVDDAGVTILRYDIHNIRLILSAIENTAVSLKLDSTQGKIGIKSIVMMGENTMMGHKES